MIVRVHISVDVGGYGHLHLHPRMGMATTTTSRPSARLTCMLLVALALRPTTRIFFTLAADRGSVAW